MSTWEHDDDHRRLHRSLAWRKHGDGVYGTADAKNGVRRAGRGRWEAGVRQPYHTGTGSSVDDYDFHAPQTFARLRDAQKNIEAAEAEMPRSALQDLPFHDRRGL